MKEDSHSWGRLGGGQVVDGTLSICPKDASVAAGVQSALAGGGRAGRDGSHVGAAEGRPSGIHSGCPGGWAHRVVGGTGWGKRRNGFCPSFIS